jgi:hypothetical protein
MRTTPKWVKFFAFSLVPLLVLVVVRLRKCRR